MDLTELELAGALLYKCEGTKLRKDKRSSTGNIFYYQIEFTNSDPLLVKLFLRFLREVIKIDKERLKCELFLYPDLDKTAIEAKWSRITSIRKDRFNKTIILKANPRFKPNPLGTCKIRYVGKPEYVKMNNVIIKKLGKGASLIK